MLSKYVAFLARSMAYACVLCTTAKHYVYWDTSHAKRFHFMHIENKNFFFFMIRMHLFECLWCVQPWLVYCNTHSVFTCPNCNCIFGVLSQDNMSNIFACTFTLFILKAEINLIVANQQTRMHQIKFQWNSACLLYH